MIRFLEAPPLRHARTPLAMAALYVGDQAACGRYRQEVFQRQLVNEQAMIAQMNHTGCDVGPWGFDGGLGMF